MKLEYLEEFLALADSSSYAEAAENMFISESALSRHIMSLENELGVELIIRGARSTSLSDAGQLLVPYAQKAVDTIDIYINLISADKNSNRQKLTVGFVRSITQYGIMDLLLQFKRENPDITMLLTESDSSTLWQMAKNGECDFAFCYEYSFLSGGELNILHVVEDVIAVAVPETSHLASRSSVTLNDLQNEQFIMQSKSGALYKYCIQLLRSAGFKPKVNTYTESRHYMLDLVSHGVGIALLEKKRFADKCPENVKIIDLQPKEVKYLSLVYKRRSLTPAERKLLSFLKEKMRSI